VHPLVGWFVGSLGGAVLPEPQRSALERRFGGDSALTSFVLGAVEFVAGVKWLYENAMAFLAPLADRMATTYLQEANRRAVGTEETTGFTLGGAVLWLAWLLRPWTWFLISIPLVGLLRVSSYLSTRQPVAEPIAWALTRLVTLTRERFAVAQERAAFGGAGEADEVEEGEGGELFVFTPRKRPDWVEGATIEVAERFYRPSLLEPVERAGRRRYRYRFAPAGEHDVIRRFLRYELPKTGIRWAQATVAPETTAPNATSDG